MAHSVVLAEQEQAAKEKITGAVPAGPRQVTTIEYLSFPPTFTTESETTLDPTKLGRLGLDPVDAGDQLTITYPLRIAKVVETVNGSEYTERWRGNTIVDISPHGQWMPMFLRP